jgi:hypothetical protein
MNGYLMHEMEITPGEDNFLESFSPESRYGVVFEDDGETGYFYAVEKEEEGTGVRILDALHIYEDESMGTTKSKLMIVWSKDWMKCALVLDGYCHAIFDFAAHGGYSINEFPPPNEIWTKGERKLTNELIQSLF